MPMLVSMSMIKLVLKVISMSDMLDSGLESVVGVSGVLNDPGATVGFLHGVATLYLVAIPGLPLLLDVSGLSVLHAVVEFVLGVMLGLFMVTPLMVIIVRSNWRPMMLGVMRWRPLVDLGSLGPLVVLLMMILPLLGRLMVCLNAVAYPMSMSMSVLISLRNIAGGGHTQKSTA